MTYSQIQKKKKDISNAIVDNRLLDAFNIIEDLKVNIHSSDIDSKFNSLTDTYHNMLKYSFELAPDPERERIHNKLQQSLFEIIDDIESLWLRDNNVFKRKDYIHQSEHIEKEVNTDSAKILHELSLQNDLSKEGEDLKSFENRNAENKSQISNELFYYFWLKNQYKSSEKKFLDQLIDHKDINWSAKALMISAVSLSQMRHFDREKFFLLFDFMSNQDHRIRQRAIIGIFISILIHDKRIPLYKGIMNRLQAISDDKLLMERFLAVLIQFIRASDTERITKKIQEEIVPEVIKIRSELEDKLNLKDLLDKENFDEKNPEWESFFKDAPDVYQKLEQFSKMQTEGADVFMGAFANLKHFEFFKEMANWFLPFDGENRIVGKAFEGLEGELDIPTFVEGFEESSVMCNSDKFSFCLNIQFMPTEQRKMMFDLFNMELKAMNEMNEDEFKLRAESKNKIVNTQYFQDLYRFFKLYPDRTGFSDIFKIEADILNSEVLKLIFGEQKVIKNLAEFYFATDKYADVIYLFESLNKKENSFELFEKMGFCYQKLGNYSKAIELYKQAELFDKNKIWLQKKLGFCYRKTGDITKAIAYYKQILEAEPNDLNNLAYLGQLHMDIEKYEDALKYYYRVEYEKPDNYKVYRPIGWCSFVQGKYETAIKYFQKIIDVKALKGDYLNIGHCYWAAGRMDMALESYRQAVQLSSFDHAWFREAFQNDMVYLRKCGIEILDIALMIDYVLIA